MTREEAIEILNNWDVGYLGYSLDEVNEAIRMATEALKEESCETIKEILKDYEYDTETEDFLVYRHMYTGHEIHIEKPVPKYRSEQEPCEDCVSRQAVLDAITANCIWENEYNLTSSRIKKAVESLPSVTPKQKTGHWISLDNWLGIGHRVECSECGQRFIVGDYVPRRYCTYCGTKMESEEV